MNKHEIEARLEIIRAEMKALEDAAEEHSAEMKAAGRKMEEQNQRLDLERKIRRETRERQRSSVWGNVKLMFGFEDKPVFPPDLERDGSTGSFFDGLKAVVMLPIGIKAMQKYEELKQEEGRLLDQLDAVKTKGPSSREEQREKIYQEMAIRKTEWGRIRERETDEATLRRLKNMYDDADARDEERLRNLL
ncbi:MAG TPA: hypothetical protein VJT15_02680 [Pyrinomonadaceae bacterium]|nr:hypothetical protein [Pyrinomonadaceae bacterium]